MAIRRLSPLSSILAVLIVAAPAAAQPRPANLRVFVEDPSGGAIPAATVTLVDASAAERQAQSNGRGEAVFDGLAPGTYRLRVEFSGFETYAQDDVRLRPGSNKRNVRLKIARVSEELTVGRDSADRRIADVFSNTLTAEQIAQLPDDPDELEQALRQMAGPDAVLRVNGFRGGRMPPKSQIREIRFRMDPYAAENHDPGHPLIDIRTKPGMNGWRSGTNFGFRDESLNARNALAPYKAAEQTRRFGWTIDGPLRRERASFALNIEGIDAYEAKTIRAARPDGFFTSLFRQPTSRLNIAANVEHVLNASHTLRVEFQRENRDQRNLGVGDFDLPERAFLREQVDNIFRVSDVGALSKKIVNETRLQARWQDVESIPASTETAVQVLNAFNSGGAQVSGGRRSFEVEAADNLDISAGRHALKVGALAEAGRHRSDELRNANGTFTFASLEEFLAGRPTTYTQRLGNPLVEYSTLQFSWYAQDDVRLKKNLQVGFGLRHEVQAHLADWNNFAPRASLTWSPLSRTTLRAGAGLFYDWYEGSTYEQTRRVDGTRQRDLVIRAPGYPDPAAGGLDSSLPPGRITAAPDLVMPRVGRVSLGVEQQIGRARVMFNTFVQEGRDELRSRNVNAPVAGVRPDPFSGNVLQIESTGRSSTRGMSVGANLMNPEKGMFLNGFYILTDTRNDGDDPLSLPADSFNLAGEWGPSRTDVRHRLFTMANARLAWNLRAGASFRAQSSSPYNITTGFDDNGDTVSNDRPEGVRRNSARGDAQWNMDLRLSWGRGFGRRPEPAGSPMPRVRTVRVGDDDVLGGMGGGPDAAASRVHLEIYGQAYNLFNTSNFVNYSGVLTSPFFGRPAAALPGRRIETGVRVNF